MYLEVTSLLSLSRLSRGFMSAMLLHTFLILNLRSAVKSEKKVRSPFQESLCISFAASQSLKGIAKKNLNNLF